MKVGILTYYGVHSHGAVLQANAMKKVLEGFGHEVVFIKFDRDYRFIPEEQVNKYKIGFGSIGFYLRYLIEKGYRNIIYNLKKNRILNQYRENNFPMGKNYSEEKCDAVIIGSDEVFSLEIGYNKCMYGVGVLSNRIIGYATCFGPTNMEEIEKKGLVEEIKNGLQKFRTISARDNNTKQIVEKLTHHNVPIVCDPVFLYGYEQERELPNKESKPYMLVYSYDRNMNKAEEIEIIKQYSKQQSYTLISIGYPHDWCDKNVNATPEELIAYIKHASFVLTDTFHGSVISILCNTQFAAIIRGNGNKLGFLLSEYNLDNRIIGSIEELTNIAMKEIDYQTVNTVLSINRKKSIDYLINALEN